jgi:hypothetical protein
MPGSAPQRTESWRVELIGRLYGFDGKTFREADHPRKRSGHEAGQFARKGSSGTPSIGATKGGLTGSGASEPRIKPNWKAWNDPKLEKWAKIAAEKEFRRSEKDPPQVKAVRDKLLKAGGVYSATDNRDPHLKEIVEKGERFSTKGARQMSREPGMQRFYQPNQCHWNAYALWKSGEAVAIGRGYALDEPGVRWIQHSWGIDKEGRVMETTFPASAYVGVRLEGEEAKAFGKLIGPRSAIREKGYAGLGKNGPHQKW